MSGTERYVGCEMPVATTAITLGMFLLFPLYIVARVYNELISIVRSIRSASSAFWRKLRNIRVNKKLGMKGITHLMAFVIIIMLCLATVGGVLVLRSEEEGLVVTGVGLSSSSLGGSGYAPGEEITVTVNVKNKGDSGSYSVSLQVDGETIETQQVNTPPGRTGSLTFTFTLENSGTYSIQVGEVTKTIEVMWGGITTSVLPYWMAGSYSSCTLEATGGTEPYTWGITDGSLPEGLTLSTEGVIWGATEAKGISEFTVQVTDSSSPSNTDNRELRILVMEAPTTYTLTTSVSPSGSGSVDVSPAGPYDSGTVVTVTAVPASGYRFSSWSGDLTGSVNPTTITMDSGKSVTANFIESVGPTYTLTTSVSPLGSGTVSPASGTYNEGASVTLTATAESGYVFDSWSGDATGTSPSVTITMNSNKSVTANFREPVGPTYTLTTSVSPLGSGTVSPVPGTFEEGASVEITATPESGYVFDRWSGDASGTDNPTTIIMNSNKNVVANFRESVGPTYTLTTSVSPSGSGSVDVSPAGPYDSGTVVTVTAVPASGYRFSSWSGDLTGSVNPTTITMDSDKSVTANFIEWTYTVTYDDGAGFTDESTVTSEVVGVETIEGIKCYKRLLTPDEDMLRTDPLAGPGGVAIHYTEDWIAVEGEPNAGMKIQSYSSMTAMGVVNLDSWTYYEDYSPAITMPPAEDYSFDTHLLTTMAGDPSKVMDERDAHYDVTVSSDEVLGYACTKMFQLNPDSGNANTEWWSPDVSGLVKSVSLDGFQGTETWELTS